MHVAHVRTEIFLICNVVVRWYRNTGTWISWVSCFCYWSRHNGQFSVLFTHARTHIHTQLHHLSPVSEMTYTVSNGTLNPSIPYHTIPSITSSIFHTRLTTYLFHHVAAITCSVWSLSRIRPGTDPFSAVRRRPVEADQTSPAVPSRPGP